jgi:hypothetical protein
MAQRADPPPTCAQGIGFPLGADGRFSAARKPQYPHLMEGLWGTAIRLAVRDPGSPQAPLFPRARRHPA